MNFQFKTLSDQKVTDIVSYISKVIKDDPNVRIYIGTDSQNQAGQTTMVTVIAFRYSFNRGSHVIYKKENIKPKMNQMIPRLLLEAEKTLEVASWLQENYTSLKLTAVEFDVNKDKSAASNAIVSAVTGWGIGLGFNVLTKPDEMVATKAANELCR